MYTLTLTAGERKAIDHVGGRYAHGYDLYKLVWGQSTQSPDDADWDDPRDITCTIPEHVAWQIRDMGEECNYLWDLFSPELSDKLNILCNSIV